MYRKLGVLLFSLLLVLVSASCGKAPLGPVGLQGDNVLAAVRDLAKSYERRDLDAFMEKVSTAYPDRESFRTSVEKVFASYQTISFKLHYTKMLVMIQDKGNIKTTFTWEGEWKSSEGRRTGDARFRSRRVQTSRHRWQKPVSAVGKTDPVEGVIRTRGGTGDSIQEPDRGNNAVSPDFSLLTPSFLRLTSKCS
jgi:hypothetical protein